MTKREQLAMILLREFVKRQLLRMGIKATVRKALRKRRTLH